MNNDTCDFVDWKRAGELKDFAIDWEPALTGGQIISSSEWEGDDVGLEDDSVIGAITVVRASGGTTGKRAYLTNRVVLSGGQELERVIGVDVKRSP